MGAAGKLNEQIMKLLLDYAGSQEDSVKRFREGLTALVQEHLVSDSQRSVEVRVGGWNPDNVIWVEASGPSGDYQLATDENNRGNSDFNELLKDLEAHQGCLMREGWFYWRFQQKPFVGRKKRS